MSGKVISEPLLHVGKGCKFVGEQVSVGKDEGEISFVCKAARLAFRERRTYDLCIISAGESAGNSVGQIVIK